MSRLALVLIALSFIQPAAAELLERQPVCSPQGDLVAAGPARVVAGGTGTFLVHNERVSTSGERLDDHAITGATGYAVAWPDGWLMVQSDSDFIYVRHLEAAGEAASLVLTLPAVGEFVAAASNGERLAILEQDWGSIPRRLWISVIDRTRLIHRQPVAALDGATITAFRDGFMLASYVRESGSPYSIALHVWRLDADGIPREFRLVGRSPDFYAQLALAAHGDKALLVVNGSVGPTTVRVVDEALATTEPIVLTDGIGTDVRTFPLALDDGFLVSYTLESYGPRVTSHRAAEISREGALVSDGAADPIVTGDRSGERFLVMRPWGDAAIAEGDPRHVISDAIRFERLSLLTIWSIDVVSSGAVSLIAPQSYPAYGFVRVDERGTPIDQEPVPLPSNAIAAIPDGFAFVSITGGTIRMQRLAREGDWIDATPLTIGTAPGARVVAAHGNGRDLLVAWLTDSEIVWARFGFDGSPLHPFPRSAPFSDPDAPNSQFHLGIAGSGNDRLLLMQEQFLCQISPCLAPTLVLGALALDRDALPLGPLRLFESYASAAKAVGLSDATWVVPLGDYPVEVLHLARDGAELSRVRTPVLDYLVDFEATSSGWRAFLGSSTAPVRLVEIDGASMVRGVLGLSAVSMPRFAASGRIAYVAPVEQPPGALVPWTARLSIDGETDLAVSLTLLGTSSAGVHVAVLVKNEGAMTATNVVVFGGDNTRFDTSGGNTLRLASIAPGETAVVTAVSRYAQPGLTFMVFSEDLLDTDVTNNSARLSDARPREERRRPMRGGQ